MRWMQKTRPNVLRELAERELDLKEFSKARSILMNRILYSRDHEEEQYLPIHDWAGTHAIMNVFDLVLNSMEGVVNDLRTEYERLPVEEPN